MQWARPALAFCSRLARNGASSSGALFIQAGANNPNGVARTLVQAINACHQETVWAREDPQCGYRPLARGSLRSLRNRQHAGRLGKLNDECRVKDAAIKATAREPKKPRRAQGEA